MRDRIREFLTRENKSSSQFAEEINVQASGVSHVLSGRNKPSLDFILKMLSTYSSLNTDWLLFGRGNMYNSGEDPVLIDETGVNKQDISVEKYREPGLFDNAKEKSDDDKTDLESQFSGSGDKTGTEESKRKGFSEKIIILYPDGSYSEYNPRT